MIETDTTTALPGKGLTDTMATFTAGVEDTMVMTPMTNINLLERSNRSKNTGEKSTIFAHTSDSVTCTGIAAGTDSKPSSVIDP
jgi:hypothetical protein